MRATTALIVLLLSVIAGIGLLIWLLGYSALVGVGVGVVRHPTADRLASDCGFARCRYATRAIMQADIQGRCSRRSAGTDRNS